MSTEMSVVVLLDGETLEEKVFSSMMKNSF